MSFQSYSSMTLRDSVLMGHASVCESLIKSGADVSERYEDGSQPIHLAARKGHVDVCKILLENKADVRAKGRNGFHPLHEASLKGHASVCEYLITSARADVCATDNDRNHPLHFAATNGHIDVCKILVENNANVLAKGSHGHRPLHWASFEGQESVCEYLIVCAGADVGACNKDGNQALYLAACKGHVDVCEVLVENKADVLAKGYNGDHPLHTASFEGQASVCEYLVVCAGADVGACNKDGNQALHLAAWKGHVDVCKVLVENKADVLAKGYNGNHPLHRASLEGQASVCEYLIVCAGANVTACDDDGDQALHLAALKGHVDVCKVLVENKADVLAKGYNGNHPLHRASLEGQASVCEYLIVCAGANVTACDDDGDQALHLAALKGHVDVCKVLVENKADVLAKGYNGDHPLHTASFEGQASVCEYLIVCAGADIGACNKNDDQALHLAALKGHVDVCKVLVQNRADVLAKGYHGSHPLHRASLEGQASVCEYLIVCAGADVGACSKDGSQALHLAALKGHVDVCKVLVQNKADVLAKGYHGNHPLHTASFGGQASVCEYLVVSAGADVGACNKNGNQALHLAAWKGHVDVCKVLVENKADVLAKGYNGNHPLHTASFEGQASVCEYLIVCAGANVTACDEDGDQALHLAAWKGHVDVCKVLVENKADVLAKESNGNHPLHTASFVGQASVCEYLIVCAGADVGACNKEGSQALHLAARKGHVDVCKVLVENKADVLAKGSNGNHPLHTASLEGQASVCEYLVVSAGADVGACNKNGNQALHLAAWKGHVDVCKVLVENKADVLAKGSNGNHPLHTASLEGQASVCEYLIVCAGADVGACSKDGSQALHLAALKGHVDVCKVLVENKADVLAKGYNGDHPLHTASFVGQASVCEYLIVCAGADVGACNKEGSQALHLAARKGHVDVCKVLVENKADVLAKGSNGNHPLHTASRKGQASVCEYLVVSAGADVGACNKNGNQALHLSAWKGHVDVCKVLVENKADVLAKGSNGNHPLHTASLEGQASVCEYLVVSAGADVGACNKNGNQALHLAAWKGHVDVCKVLVENKADVLAKESNGNHPLHTASFVGQASVCEYLIVCAGADVGACNKEGSQALHLAARKGHVDVCKVLVENKADVLAKGSNGNHPLHTASLEGQASVCEYLVVSAGADVGACNKNGNQALHLAASTGKESICRLLLDINSGLLKAKNNQGEQAIHRAFRQRKSSVFSCLLALYTDADLNEEMGIKLLEIINSFDRLPSELASMVCSFLSRRAVASTVIQQFCETLGKASICGGDKDSLAYIFSCISEEECRRQVLKPWLIEASLLGKEEIVIWLVFIAGADVDVQNESGKPVFLIAAEHGHKTTCKILLSGGAGADTFSKYTVSSSTLMIFCDFLSRRREKTGSSAALAKNVFESICSNSSALSSYQNRASALRKLVSSGYAQEWEDDVHSTSALKAILTRLSEKMPSKKSEDTLCLCWDLVRIGADLCCTDEGQKTLLHYAASAGLDEMCRSLLERGASPLARDSSGKVAWEMASSSGHTELAAYLRKVGSVPDEILSQGGEAVNIYLSAFRDGAASCTFFRVDVVGKDGCGKTSLIKSLTRQKFDSKEPSTEGVETACKVIVKETCNWAKIVEIRERKRVYYKAAAASVAKRLRETNPLFGEERKEEGGVVALEADNELSFAMSTLASPQQTVDANNDAREGFEDDGAPKVVSSSDEEKEASQFPTTEREKQSLIAREPRSSAFVARDDFDSRRERTDIDVKSARDERLSESASLLPSLAKPTTTPPSDTTSSVSDYLSEHVLATMEGLNERPTSEEATLALEQSKGNENRSLHNTDESSKVLAVEDFNAPLSPLVRESSPSPSQDAVAPPMDAIDTTTNLSSSVEGLTRLYLADPGALDQALSDIYIDLLDYGGQHIYYTTHFSFLNKEAIYFVVFDVSLPLDDLAKSSFRSLGEEHEIADDSIETNYDRLEEWLSSICVMEPPDQSPNGQGERNAPYIFLVGTHRDKLGRKKAELQKFLKRQNDCLKENFKGRDFFSHIIPASPDTLFYAVDNTKSSPGKKAKRDQSVVNLERDVEEFAKKLSRPTPLRWLKFETYVRDLKTKYPKEKVVSIERLRDAARTEAEITKDEEFKVLIRFLTNRAVLLYHPFPGATDDSAVVDVQWLARVFQKVVTVHLRIRTPLEYHNDLERAKSKGIVTSAYLNHLLSEYSDYRKKITELLMFFDLVCPYKILEKTGNAASDDDNDERDYVCLESRGIGNFGSRCQRSRDHLITAYFVPCLLTKDEKLYPKRGGVAEPLALYSEKYRIPQTLFYRIMARLAGRFGRCPRLHPKHGYFVVYQDHRLEINLNRYSITFTVFPIRGDRVKSQVCSRVREYVFAFADDCKRNGMAGLELHLGCLKEEGGSVLDEKFFCLDEFVSGKNLEQASDYIKKVISFWFVQKFYEECSSRSPESEQLSSLLFRASIGSTTASGSNSVAINNTTINLYVGKERAGRGDLIAKSFPSGKIRQMATAGHSDSSGGRGEEDTIDSSTITWETFVSCLLAAPVHRCIEELAELLNPIEESGDDWRELARKLLGGYQDAEKTIRTFEKQSCPTTAVLKKWVKRNDPHDATVRILVNVLTVIYRTDAALVVHKYVTRQNSGCPRPVQVRLIDIVGFVVKQKSKVEELASALNADAPSGSQTNTLLAINQIIRSWIERDFDEATEQALLLACSQIGILEEIRARAATKNVELPPLQKDTKEEPVASRKRNRSPVDETSPAKKSV